MKFSVIVPVYKVEDCLPQCVDSILNQDFDDFELILVDDGSPDNSGAICDEYAEKDNRVVVIHKENGGASDARNVGIKAAIGDYLMFVDSDDYWDSTSVFSKVSDILNKTKADLVQFGHKKFFSEDNRITTSTERNLSVYNGYSTKDVLQTLVKTNNLKIAAWAMAVSRKFIIDNGIFFETGKRTEDLEWAVHLYTCEPKWSFIDDVFYVYRTQRETSVTATIDYKHLCDYCWMLEKSLEHAAGCREVVKNALMSYLMYQTLIASAVVFKVKLSKEQKNEIVSRLKAICKGNITKYTLNNKVKLAGCIYRVGGYSLMARVLGFYLNNRGR